MSDLPQLLSVIVPLTTVLGIVLAYFRFKPGQREAVLITVKDAELSRTEKAFDLVAEQLAAQIERMDTEIDALRRRIAEADKINDQLREDLRVVKGRLITAVQQRDELRDQLDQLLKARGETP